MSSRSSVEQIAAWTRSRFPLSLYGPLAGLITAAALTANGACGVAHVFERVGVALLLLFQFRLWDDLADRLRDRSTHPERVLARASSVSAFRWLLVIVTLAVVLIVAVRSATFGTARPVLVLVAGGGLYYGVLRPHLDVLPATALLLAKYPGFVLVLRPPAADSAPVLVAAALVYATLVLFELTDDDRLATTSGARVLRRVTAGIYVATALLAVATLPRPVALGAVAGSILTLILFGGNVPADARARRRRGYLGFLACALVVASFYLGASGHPTECSPS